VSPEGGEGWREVFALIAIAVLTTVVRLAHTPPAGALRLLWTLLGGLGLCTGGWLLAKAGGLDGWGAMAAAWVFGVLGSDATHRIIRAKFAGVLDRMDGGQK
jgi:hypothetical protein